MGCTTGCTKGSPWGAFFLLSEGERGGLFPVFHRIFDDAQEGGAVAGGLLFAHAADVQQLVQTERLFLHHLPQSGVAEHHKGRHILLAGQPFALGVQGIQQFFVGLAERGGPGGFHSILKIMIIQ